MRPETVTERGAGNHLSFVVERCSRLFALTDLPFSVQDGPASVGSGISARA